MTNKFQMPYIQISNFRKDRLCIEFWNFPGINVLSHITLNYSNNRIVLCE